MVNENIETFCRTLYAELEKDGWGLIDPYIFKHISDPAEGEELDEDDMSMVDILERTFAKLGWKI